MMNETDIQRDLLGRKSLVCLVMMSCRSSRSKKSKKLQFSFTCSLIFCQYTSQSFKSATFKSIYKFLIALMSQHSIWAQIVSFLDGFGIAVVLMYRAASHPSSLRQCCLVWIRLVASLIFVIRTSKHLKARSWKKSVCENVPSIRVSSKMSEIPIQSCSFNLKLSISNTFSASKLCANKLLGFQSSTSKLLLIMPSTIDSLRSSLSGSIFELRKFWISQLSQVR